MFKIKKIIKKLKAEGSCRIAEPKRGELPYVKQHYYQYFR